MYSSKRNPEEIYVMGCRLVSFLSDALPKHPQYHSTDPQIKNLRESSLDHLWWIQERVALIALRIDEAELNQFILSDLESSSVENQFILNDLESSSVETRSEKNACASSSSVGSGGSSSRDRDQSSSSFLSNSFHKNNTTSTTNTTGSSTTRNGSSAGDAAPHGWEDFSGWPQQVCFQPREAETSNVVSEVSFDIEEEDGGVAFPQGSPDRHYNFLFGEDNSHSYLHNSSLDLSGSILNTLAYQDVRYETDSEAHDSWAQDTETSFQSAFSNPHVTYNAAQVAFDEIMKQVRSSTTSSSLGSSAASSTTVPTSSPSPIQDDIACQDSNSSGSPATAWNLVPLGRSSSAPCRSATTREAEAHSVLGISKFSAGSSTISLDDTGSSIPLFEESSSFDVFDVDPSSIIHQEWVSFDSAF
mmetsp:Transcript_10148/g.15654  ORF Transcript_10148/g.15654 Transcript_10148/m.15654 type:complete len:416 (+) Transcript_10148:175-1422(+)